jgi:TetR/AcrR family transcriptional repressor of mexJK operon
MLEQQGELMSSADPKIRQGRKYAQVLDGAREVFLASGFEGANVDEIARVAGVSKATLYSYFPDKRLLFMEFVRVECKRQADDAIDLLDSTAPPATVLREGARRMIDFYTSEFGRRIHRTCIAESERFPDLGRNFYASGPVMARERITTYLRAASARGQLDIDDFDLAADQFIKLAQADLMDRVICGVQTQPSAAQIERVIDGAVAMFLARYARR